MSIQAETDGLRVHQMAGFNGQQVRELFAIPEGYDPFTVVAIGYFGGLELLPEDLQQRETAERSRKAWNEFIFSGAFGEPLNKPESTSKT